MIKFFTEDVTFPIAEKGIKTKLRNYLNALAENENKRIGDINFIFCSDEYLIEINKQYLNHNYYTDVITFDYSEFPKISGDVFISTDMVWRNAEEYAPSFEHELYRVIFHGVLHLCGYKDKSEEDERQMRAKENYYLELHKLNQ